MIELRVSKKQNDESPPSSALFAKTRGFQPVKGAVKKDYSKVRCHLCNQFGHFKFKCPNKSTSKSAIRGSTPAPKTSALYGEALLTEETHDDVWVPDSGASHHMTKMRNCYSSYQAFLEPKPITVGNQKQMLAYGQGDILIEALVNGERKRHCLKDV